MPASAEAIDRTFSSAVRRLSRRNLPDGADYPCNAGEEREVQAEGGGAAHVENADDRDKRRQHDQSDLRRLPWRLVGTEESRRSCKNDNTNDGEEQCDDAIAGGSSGADP